jgi:hypothetical protein
LTESLFVVSLPRSLSSATYHLARIGLGCAEPAWATDGEILNLDRFALFPGPANDTGLKFTSRSPEPQRFAAITEFLRQVVMPEGFAYKDVVQPFVVAAWLPTSGCRALRIRRDVASIAYSMLSRGWHYPARVSSLREDPEAALLDGLLQAERALDAVAAEAIDYDDLIVTEEPLNEALLKLYPGWSLPRLRYLEEGFLRVREIVIRRRSTEAFQRLEEKVRALTNARVDSTLPHSTPS